MKIPRMHYAGAVAVLLVSLVVCGRLAAVSAFDDAVAVWHLADVNDSAGKNSALTPHGKVKLGESLRGEDRRASLARGGDGRIAVLAGGYLDAKHGVGGELNLGGGAMTMLVRFRNLSAGTNTGVFSQYGGHQKLSYNLFSAQSGASLGFELGAAEAKGVYQVRTPQGFIRRDRWCDVIVRYDGKRLQMFVDGVLANETSAAGALRRNTTIPLLIGGHADTKKTWSLEGCQIDHAAVWNRALDDDSIVSLSGGAEAVKARRRQLQTRLEPLPTRFRSKDPVEFAKEAMAIRRIMSADPHRPTWHFIAPIGFMFDANGPILYKGQYHLFYLQYPFKGTGRSNVCCRGHAVSKDLVHWKDLPIAMWPDSPWDRTAVFSGNTVIDDKGIPTFIYTGNNSHKTALGVLARSYDGMLTWKKKLVMDKPPYPGTPVHWDGQIWKDGGMWHQLCGGAYKGAGAAVLWTSPDLERWTYRNRIYTTRKYGRFWELPYLLDFGAKHVLIIGVVPVRYWIGKYDKKKFEFTPDKIEAEILDPSGQYYAPNPHMVDNKGPGGSKRTIMHAWVRGGKSPTKEVPYWDGMHAIPRVLTFEDGRLTQRPIPELQALRYGHKRLAERSVDSSTPGLLKGITGNALEIVASFDPRNATAKRFGVKLRVSKDTRKHVTVYYEPSTRRFGVGGSVVGPPIAAKTDFPANGPVTLHIFLDHSVVEVFVAGRAITKRTFTDPADHGLDAFSDGGKVRLKSLDVWKMKSIWPGSGSPAQSHIRVR